MPFGDVRACAVRAEASSVFRRASSIEGVTWRTSSSKNVGMFQNETKSCGTTKVPGRNGSLRDPTEDVAKIRSAPASFSAHRFARWFTRCGGTRCEGPWRARKATCTSPWRASTTGPEGAPYGVTVNVSRGSERSVGDASPEPPMTPIMAPPGRPKREGGDKRLAPHQEDLSLMPDSGGIMYKPVGPAYLSDGVSIDVRRGRALHQPALWPEEGARRRPFVRRQGEEAREGTRALLQPRGERVPSPVDHPPAPEPCAEGAPRRRHPRDLAVHDAGEGLHRPAQPERPHERDPHAHRGRRQVRGPPRRPRVPDDQQRAAADLEVPRISERGRRADRGDPPRLR